MRPCDRRNRSYAPLILLCLLVYYRHMKCPVVHEGRKKGNDSMSQSQQDGRTQTVSVWQHILRYLLGMLVGASSLLLFVLLLIVFFLLYPLPGFRGMAISIYTSMPGFCVLLWIASLVLGIARRKERLAFSLGIFTMLVLTLLISPGLAMGWIMGVPSH